MGGWLLLPVAVPKGKNPVPTKTKTVQVSDAVCAFWRGETFLGCAWTGETSAVVRLVAQAVL